MTYSILVLMSLVVSNGLAVDNLSRQSVSLAGQDLHVIAPVLTTCAEPMADWTQAMLLDGGVSVQVGDNLISGRSAVIWLQPQGTELTDYTTGRAYLARVYVEGDVSIHKGPKARTTPMQHSIVEGAEVMVTQFIVTGEVFASSDSKEQVTYDVLSTNEIYDRALKGGLRIPSGPGVRPGARVPSVAEVVASPAGKPSKTKPDTAASAASAAIAQQLQDVTDPALEEEAKLKEPDYPIHLSAMWDPVPQVHRDIMPDGQEVFTASGRFYIWQKEEGGKVLEFMADNLVAFTQPGKFELEQDQGSQIGMGKIRAAYLSGNIVMTEDDQTMRCDEVYYDFVNKRALLVNASMRMFDEERGIPLYIRAEKLGRVSQDIWEGQQVQLTNSEFYFPQISMNISKMVLLSGETLEHHYQLSGKAEKKATPKREAHLMDVNTKLGKYTFFKWPKFVTDLERPLPALRRISVGSNSSMGTSVETVWDLAHLMGWNQPEWLDSELLVDYFSKRGPGVGVNANWETEKAFGGLIGYVMHDSGEDRLSRTQKNVESNEDIRGRFSFRHRQYLPEDWQITLETSYITDRNFLQSMYRSEFYNDKGQETLIYLKRLKDNWAFSILGKIRINDFETVTEELPSIEYHLTGQSFWDHRLTFYSDNQIARFREKYDTDAILGPQDTSDWYNFGFTRNEVDLPLMLNTIKLVPFVAGSYAHEDNYGYQRDIDNIDNNGVLPGEEDVFLGEVGFRASTMFWKEDPHLRSDLWDLNGMRHIVTPYATGVLYQSSDDEFDMRNVFHMGVSQRWQTHRGTEELERTLDWMRLDLEATFVTDDADDAVSPFDIDPYAAMTNISNNNVVQYGNQLYGPAAFVYNDPSMPFLLRRDKSYFGLVRDTINAEYAWRVSDTLAVLSDANYDIDSSEIQQFDIGVSRYVYPDLSYYVGTRYLRPIVLPVDEDGDGIPEKTQKSSNSFVGAITYRFSPRYIATFSQEYNFEFNEMIRSDLTLIRQYHRLFYSLTLSMDESLDTSEVVFSIWPQGVSELAFGNRKFTKLTGSRWED